MATRLSVRGIGAVVLIGALSLFGGDGTAGEPAQSADPIQVYSVQEQALVPSSRVVRSDEEWRRLLTPEQYRVTRHKGTEQAFTGTYWNHHDTGVYRCVACGLDLFASETKYDSRSGWPSYTQPVAEENVATEVDSSLRLERKEILCARCGAHLGHVFPDGPQPTGLRYCVNSASLIFEPEPEQSAAKQPFEKAIFAGGCFWCMESPFEKLDGALSVSSGYTGGSEANPTYKEVSSGETGHAEAVMVLYDPARISYQELLDVYWMNIDPTTNNQQFMDKGAQYRTAIFYQNEEQRRLAEQSRDRLAASGRFDAPIVTRIVPAGPFFEAEKYHQDYYRKNPARYQRYREASGRDAYLKQVWGEDNKH